jgi:coenzyme F420-0:L-glutamate ligase/coenzyme F420-1:gamma-L-glutamate ligase
VEPSARARDFAELHGKDSRVVELVLRESARIVRMERGIIIAETRHGFVCANAGIDLSNAPASDHAILLPEDCDASAQRLRKGIVELTCRDCAVIISDSFGRPWRRGLVNVALGAAGLQVLEDLHGQADRGGRPLRSTENATVDELAAAAGLLMKKSAGVPVVLVSGFNWTTANGSAQDLIRSPEEDLFR